VLLDRLSDEDFMEHGSDRQGKRQVQAVVRSSLPSLIVELDSRARSNWSRSRVVYRSPSLEFIEKKRKILSLIVSLTFDDSLSWVRAIAARVFFGYNAPNGISTRRAPPSRRV